MLGRGGGTVLTERLVLQMTGPHPLCRMQFGAVSWICSRYRTAVRPGRRSSLVLWPIVSYSSTIFDNFWPVAECVPGDVKAGRIGSVFSEMTRVGVSGHC